MASFYEQPSKSGLVVGQISTPRINTPPGVIIHCAQLQPTDRPIEDRYSVHFDADQDRLILGVYDGMLLDIALQSLRNADRLIKLSTGHGGSETAEHISQTLPQRLLHCEPESTPGVFESVDKEILETFQKDHSIFHRKSANWAQNARLILSGCTALVLDVDLSKRAATWANAGDCRLVVGSSEHNKTGSVLFETKDLNTGTEEERNRIISEHPNEENIFVGERLFGRLKSTRGFGDGYYKLPKGFPGSGQHRRYIEIISRVERPGKIHLKDAYAALFYGYKTPPYITARPQAGTYKLEQSDVVIIASDGLWDLISSEDALRTITSGMQSNSSNLASYLIQEVQKKCSPADDITILVLAFDS
ncbi:hypothetical protein CVT24_007193 [Panaeolus cyanescens]|uniref:PPM-type phosphatase domain-containing protein n=1 Tax=Panaeolus cyanescens TaxID=181874 RepID=A0A409VJM7_9AGAR|nr:hypothetical protein CVT24_007193 [Panaeolus cyanescens]